MKHIGRHIPAYIQIAGLWPQIAYTYRFGNAVDLFSLLLKVYLLKMVFTAVYAGRDTVDGIPLRQVITVITLANLQLWLMSPMIASLIQQRVRNPCRRCDPGNGGRADRPVRRKVCGC